MSERTLIVGQGVAGTIVAEKLMSRGETVCVIDHRNPFNATQASSAVINPITGRRLVKTWLFDDLMQSARAYYEYLEGALKKNLIIDQAILRVFQNAQEQNDFYGKMSEEKFQAHLSEAKIEEEKDLLHNDWGQGMIKTACRIEAQAIVEHFKSKWQSSGILKEWSFDYSQEIKDGDAVEMDGTHFERVIFCEGFEMKNNPFFNYLPIIPNKGEALIIRCDALDKKWSIKKGVTIVPLDEERFWVGSTKSDQYPSQEPSVEGKLYLEERLQTLLKVDYEILDHISGIRPTSKDRRPLIGVHPKLNQLFCFNGFGTKGISLIPFFADQFLAHVLGDQPIQKEVNIERYQSLFPEDRD